MKRRRKTVVAGDLVKIVEYTPTMPRDGKITRSARRRATSEAQKALNHRTAQGRLEEKLACNFGPGDYFATFTYRPGAEPTNRRAAGEDRTTFIRRLRASRLRRGMPLRWIYAIENKHGKGRYHAHAVINGIEDDQAIREEIESLWSWGSVHIERLFDEAHDQGESFNSWLQLARYMTKERPEAGPDDTPPGTVLYSCSRNLRKPVIVTEWIEDGSRAGIPSDAIGLEHSEIENEFSSFAYYKYMKRPITG